METSRPKILVVSSRSLEAILTNAGFDVVLAESAAASLEAARRDDVAVALVDSLDLLSQIKTAGSSRVVVLAESAAARAEALDHGADDAVSAETEAELLSRVRAQLRVHKEMEDLRAHARIAEEGFQVSQTAFQALAVTEKMTSDAFTLSRELKLGVLAILLATAAMGGIFLSYQRGARRETQRQYAVIARFERGLVRQETLIERARKAREEIDKAAATPEAHKQRLEGESKKLREQIAAAPSPDSAEVAALRRQLGETNAHLQRIDSEGRMAQGIIRSYSQSVCLLHVVVAFRDHFSGRRLRVLPVAESEGERPADEKPRYSLDGPGPEVRLDFFGTGFLVSEDGRIVTNHHVAEPWWENAEINSVVQDGLEPIAVEMAAYFPNDARAFRVRTLLLSREADLAVLQGDLGDLKRAVLSLGAGVAAVSGEPVVLMGYATGLDAILARTDEATVKTIVETANGNPRAIMSELARRRLIRPLVTQGHLGDVLRDKLVYDAQTTSGGSGGPLFNSQGKVIGVNFAILAGFGGSNFGIPIRFAEPLLKK